jgi:serine phosphatase RsbU (regulator of sigma subunit)
VRLDRTGGGGRAARLGRRPTLRFPIALKFAVLIAVLALGSMLWQAYTALREANAHLEREINTKGVLLANTVADFVDPRWLSDLARRDDMQSLLRRFSEGPGRGEVEDIIVYSEERQGIVASSRSRFETQGVQLRTQAVPVESTEAVGPTGGVRVSEFEADGTPVRSFSKPLLSADEPQPLGRVEVFLSASEIAESRRRLSGALTQVSVVACIAAAVGSFFLGTLLTRPIRTLADDMHQVSHGHLEHRSQVQSSDEVGDLAWTFNQMTANLKAAEAVKLERKAIEHEVALAAGIQERLLPAGTPEVPGFDLARSYAAAKEVGGDYYDFLEIDPERLAVVVADVSGKSIPASLVMTMTRSLLHMAAQAETSPADTILEVNRCLTRDMNPGMFVTLLYLVLHLPTRELEVIRAGHNAPLLFSKSRAKVIPLQPRGIALGLDHSETRFRSELEVLRLTLHTGDVLVAYTDGVVEGKSPSGEDFGDERLSRLVLENHSRSAQDLVDAVVRGLIEHQARAEQSDDRTIVVLKAT